MALAFRCATNEREVPLLDIGVQSV